MHLPHPLPALPGLLALRGGASLTAEASALLLRGGGDGSSAAEVSALIQQTTLYLGTGMAAMAGTITAGSKEMDLFGCVIVGAITAIGGGTLRDIVLGRRVYWLVDQTHLNIALAVSVAIFSTWPSLQKFGVHP